MPGTDFFELKTRKNKYFVDVGTPPPPLLHHYSYTPISSSGFFFSGWSPREILGQWNGSAQGFLAQNRRLKQPIKNKDILFELPSLFPSDQLLTKKPGIEVACTHTQPRSNVSLKLKNVSSPFVKHLGQFFVLIRKISFTNEVET